MCISVPAKVIRFVEGSNKAVVSVNGAEREVSLAMIDVAIGDYVIAHVGYALRKLDAAEAKQMLGLLVGLSDSFRSDPRC